MTDDVILNKAEIIERCLKRIREEYDGNPENLRQNQTKQDSIILNLERACQAAIDLAMRLVKLNNLGIPGESRAAFELITQKGIIDAELNSKMQGLVGFRNTAVHNYKKLDLDIVEAVITYHLKDFQQFIKTVFKSSLVE